MISAPWYYLTAPLVSYRINRQLYGWYLPPLAFRAVGAYCPLFAEAVEELGAIENQATFDQTSLVFGHNDSR